MGYGLDFYVLALMLGAALAMDAFSVSLAGGLHEPHMKRNRMCMIAGVFAGFQAVMPMIGYVCARTVVTLFGAFEKAIPWIALVLLCIIGGKMLFDGLRRKKDEEVPAVRFGVLMLQGVATSIDALSVGFSVFESYGVGKMLVGVLIIACVTFVICIGGLLIGRKAGTAIGGRAEIIGGIILIAIGIEIFIKG